MRRVLMVTGLLLVAAAGVAHLTATFVVAANVPVDALSGPGGAGPFVFEDGNGDDVTTITVGDTVVWTFEAGAPHTVTSDTSAFSSGAQQDGGTFQFTFNSAGTFDYHCIVHGAPGGAGMAGTVIVQAANTNTPAPTNTSAPGATNTATRTPTRTATRTSTPQATSTGTVTAVPTAAVATTTPIVAAPISATQPPAGGGAAPSVSAPIVGSGDAASSGGPVSTLAMALGAAGVCVIVGATLARQRR